MEPYRVKHMEESLLLVSRAVYMRNFQKVTRKVPHYLKDDFEWYYFNEEIFYLFLIADRIFIFKFWILWCIQLLNSYTDF